MSKTSSSSKRQNLLFTKCICLCLVMECLIRITVAAAPLCICVSFCICRHVHLLVYCTILRTAYPSDPEIAFSDPMGANTSSTCYLYTNVSLYVSLYLYLYLYSFHQHNLLHGKLLLSQVSQISQVFATSTSCK